MPDIAITPPMLAGYAELFAPLAAMGFTLRINTGPYPMDAPQLADFIADAEAAIVGLDALSADVFTACPALQIVARNGVGLDNVDLAAASAAGVRVTAPFGANSSSVAELTFGLMISLLRGVAGNHARIQAGTWQREIGTELSGKTLGIIGLGRIGKKVATRARAFDMTVIANDIAPDAAFAAAHDIRCVSFEALLASADIISLHVPLNASTHHLIDAAALAGMKAGAWLLNTARGPVLDAQALADALDSGHLAGAALDVHTVEGQLEDCLRHRPNLITTTHLGAYTHEALMKTSYAAAESLVKYFRREHLDTLVNHDVSDLSIRSTNAITVSKDERI